MKLAVKIVGAFIGLVIIAVLAFVFLVDANKFKPRIEAMARDQGIALQINGDLGWNLWPSLGVAVNGVRVAALETSDQSIAEIKQASLMLALRPLFSGEFKVDHVAVDGANVSLSVDAAGKGNWEALIKQDKTPPPAQAAPATDGNLKLDIQHISLTSSKVSYTDAQSGQKVELRDLNVSMSDVNLRAESFPMEVSFVAELAPSGGDKLEFQGKVNNSISVDSAFSTIKLDGGKAQLEVKGKESANLDLAYSIALTDLQNNLAYKGQLKLAEINARKLLAAFGTALETADKNALSKVAFSANIDGTAKKVKLDNLQLALDSTSFKGSVAVTDFSTSAIKVVLDGDTINVDNYLPPPVETPAAAANTPVAPPAKSPPEDTQLPIELLRGLDINAKLSLQKMTINKIDLENVVLKVLAKNGMIEPELSAKAYSGNIVAKGQLDARGAQSQLQFDAGVTGLELAPLLKDQEMDSKFGLKGAIQLRALGSAQGNSTNALFKSLRSNANFSGAQVQVSPINLEEQFCKLVNLVNQSADPTQKWDAYTEMSELSGSIKIRDQIVTIDSFKAGVEKLQLGSTGKINLATDEYDIFLPFKLLKDKTDIVTSEQVAVTTSADTSTGGCSIGSQYWLERGMELLRCRGSFDEINPLKDCRPDSTLLRELTKDYAVYKLKEKHGAKYEEKKEELKEKVEKEKNKLLDKLQQHLNKGANASSTISVSSDVNAAAESNEGSAAQ